jgi:hypothetical protein
MCTILFTKKYEWQYIVSGMYGRLVFGMVVLGSKSMVHAGIMVY